MRLNNTHIEPIGRLLFGNSWRYDFADYFGINTRFLRRILNGSEEIPPGLAQEIETALRDTGSKIDDMLEVFADDGITYDGEQGRFIRTPAE